jgi:hypothetical protein
VSKRQDTATIRQALALGVVDFGENYAQEFRSKRRELGDTTIRWHFIGALQTNKVKYLLGTELIHTIDRASVLDEFEGRAAADDSYVDTLVQVNVEREPQKAGVDPAGLAELLDHYGGLSRVRCRGLMLIPATGSEANARAAFRELRHLRDRHAARARAQVELEELSMGMSADYPTAIEEGATIVRVGTALFGER